MWKCLASNIDNSVITWDEIIEETKTVKQILMKKNATCKTKSFYILLAFLLITIALLIANSLLIDQNKNIFAISLHKWQIKKGFVLINVLQIWIVTMS